MNILPISTLVEKEKERRKRAKKAGKSKNHLGKIRSKEKQRVFPQLWLLLGSHLVGLFVWLFIFGFYLSATKVGCKPVFLYMVTVSSLLMKWNSFFSEWVHTHNRKYLFQIKKLI